MPQQQVLITQQVDGVVHSTVEDRTSGSCYTVRSRFVIGCDGARSKVRNNLGIDMEGEDTCESLPKLWLLSVDI